MAMSKCKECGKEISTKADKCPHCGAPQKPKQYGCGTLILVVFIIGIFGSIFSSNDNPGSSGSPQVPDSECIKTLQCWGDKHNIAAAARCKEPVEKLAKYTARWTDGTFEPKFSHFRWFKESEGIVTYIGDKIEFQNGFGAWQAHVYECDYNPKTEQVLDVRARPGRL
jgi:hypothetical protein